MVIRARVKKKDEKCEYASFSMTLPPLTTKDRLSWARVSPDCSVAGFTEGPDLDSQDRQVVIRSITAHQMGFIYIVNASYYPIQVSLPNHAVAIVAGSSQDQTVNLVRPKVGIWDVTPSWGMSPTAYKWPEVPDDSGLH